MARSVPVKAAKPCLGQDRTRLQLSLAGHPRPFPQIVTGAVSAPENRNRRAAVIQHADPMRLSFRLQFSEALIRAGKMLHEGAVDLLAASGEGSTRSVECPRS